MSRVKHNSKNVYTESFRVFFFRERLRVELVSKKVSPNSRAFRLSNSRISERSSRALLRFRQSA